MEQTKAAAAGSRDPLAGIVDELGALEAEMAPHAPKLARIEALRKSLRAKYDDADPDKAFTAHGETFYSILGPRNLERKIADITKVYRALGRAVFLQRCSFSLRHLEELGVGLEYVVARRTGPRTLQTLRKP